MEKEPVMSKQHNFLLVSISEGVAVFQFNTFMGQQKARVSL